MRCPFCKNKESKVVDKRSCEEGRVNRRRRECNKCKKRFSTYERFVGSSILILKKGGSRESFDENKIKNGILKACEKRPIPQEKIDKIVSQVVQKVLSCGKPEIKSKTIGEIVIKKLKALDKVAYLRFASVYKDFDDVSSFEKELKQLKR